MKRFFCIFLSLSIIFLASYGINCVYGYLFPIRFEKEVSDACEAFDVEKCIVYSVINVESGFRKDVVSSKGAVGLMQILPSTAQEIALKLNIENLDLLNPEQNILIGTYYLSYLLKRFGNEKVALCAYNAGPANVLSWLKNEQYSDDGKTLKTIPVQETKNYIKKINKNKKYYSKKTNA